LSDLPRVELGYCTRRAAHGGGGDVGAPVEIAPRTEADLGELYGLAKETFGDFPGWSDERVLGVLWRDLVFVARERAQVAGYVALRRDPDTVTIVVDHVFVAPGHEQHGVGRQLLAYAEGYAIAHEAQALRIVAEESNWRARTLYRRLGFVPVEEELLELVLPRAG
jgi:ribosomal protein S18 acetylase RimI-like enzyme